MTEPELDEPPHNLRAEMAAAGAAILSTAALAAVIAVVPAEGWYSPRHGTIVAAAQAVVDRGEALDPVTVTAELDRRGELTRVGGAPYLHTLIATVPTAANAGYYAEIVAEKATQRRVVEIGRRLVQMGHESHDAATALEWARAKLDAATPTTAADEAWPALLDRVVDSYDQAIDPGLPTPWPDLDDIIGGLAPGTLTVIGARPGGGKSIALSNLASHAAAGGIPTLVHSLEMPRAELVHRIIAAEAGVEYRALHSHRLTDWDWPRVRKAQAAIRDLPLHIDDRSTISVAQIRATARNHGDLGLIVVDYLQLVQGPDARAPREQQVAGVSRGLKLLARDLAVPVVVAAQINRAATTGTGRPQLSHLRESGAIESDADLVILLHRDPERPGEVDADVAKHRHGATGVVSLQWAGHYARLRTLAQGGAA
jgi:replicative DNA helicase